jgi:putative peptide zinc metalloprotease protein
MDPVNNPKMAPGIVVRLLSSKEETYVMLKDPATQNYFKFEIWEKDIFDLLDGTRDLQDLDAAFREKHPELGTDLPWMVDYLEGLRKVGLLERSEQERHLVMMDKVKSLRKRRFYDAENSTLMQITIPLFDPNKLMDRIIPWIRWWWSPWFVGAWVVVFGMVLGFLVHYWDLYWTGFFRILDLTQKGFWDWIGFLALLFGVSVWHELGHGFACKRFGGEVHNIGFMIFYLQPAFYCNVDDSYLFEKRSHRLAATFGGPYFELMMCSVAAAIWLTTPAEWWLHSLALTIVFFTGLSVVLLNVNPLIKLDGYYILMDWLDVPDLREESFEYLGGILKRRLLGIEVPAKAISRRRRRIYATYGICAILYTGLVLYVMYLLAQKWLVGWLGPSGYIALAGLTLYLYRSKIAMARRFLKNFMLTRGGTLKSIKGRWILGSTFAGLAILLFLIPSATRVDGTFTVEPLQRAVIRAPAKGVVHGVLATEGGHVSVGGALATLQSTELQEKRDVARADLERSRLEAAGARHAEDIPTFQEKDAAAREATSRLALVDGRVEGLTLRSPVDGVVSTPYLEEKEGAYLREGDIFCTVDRLDRVRLMVGMAETDIEEIRDRTPVRILLSAHPESPLQARVLSLSPVAVTPDAAQAEALDLVRRAQRVRVLVEIGNDSGLFRPGMTGRIQFLTKSRSIAGKVLWRLSRWAGSVFW